jgi:hypothetical protein
LSAFLFSLQGFLFLFLEYLFMAGSLSVLKISSFEKEKFLKEKVIVNGQNNLSEEGLINGPGVERTILTLDEYNKEKDEAFYSVLQYSNVIKKPIRAYVDFSKDFEDMFNEIDVKKSVGVKEITKGYHEIPNYPVN